MINKMSKIYCKGTIEDVIEYEYNGEIEHVHGVKSLDNYKINIKTPYAKLLIDEIPEKIYAYFVFPQVYDEGNYNDFIVWIPQLFSDYYSLFCCYEDEIKCFIKYLKELDVNKISEDEEYEDLDYFTRLHINGDENNEIELDMHSGDGQGTNYILFANVKFSSLKELGNDLEKAYKKAINKNSKSGDINISVEKGKLIISSEAPSVDGDKVLNESEEFKDEMEKLKASGKNLCAFVSFYPEGGGKTYTYLVDAYYHGGRWFVEDTDKEVFVMEFGELTNDELPVPKDKMKHLRWEENDNSVVSEKTSNNKSKKEFPFYKLVWKEGLNDAFERAEIYLDIKFPDFKKNLTPDILGDFYYYEYKKDEKTFRLCMDVWPNNAVWIESNFEFDTPDFVNEKIYVKEIGELSIDQQKELALIYFVKYPDFHFKKSSPVDYLFSEKSRTDFWLYDSNSFIKIRSKEENDKIITFVESNIDIDVPTLDQIQINRYLSSFTYVFNARSIDKETERNLEKVDGALNVDLDMGVITILNILSIDLTKDEIAELKSYALARNFFIDGDLIAEYEHDNFERIYKDYSYYEDEGCLYFKGNSEGLTTVLPIRRFVKSDQLFWVDLMRKCTELIRRHFTPYIFSKFTKEEREIIKFHIGLYEFK